MVTTRQWLRKLRFTTTVLLCGLQACTFVDINHDVTYGIANHPIPKETLSAIEPGRTTRDWLIDHLGEPMVSEIEEAGLELMTYRFEEHRHNKTRVMFFYRYQHTQSYEHLVYVRLSGGVVEKVWRDPEHRLADSPR